MKIAKETWVILAIGIADLITTIIFIKHQGAEEANPLFKHYWEMGVLAFVVAKIVLLVGPLCVLEWARKRNPAFVSWALRTAIAGYLVMYGIGFVRLNSPARADAMVDIARTEANIPAIVDTRMQLFIRKRQMHRRLTLNPKGGVQQMQPFSMPLTGFPNKPHGPVAKLVPASGTGPVIVSDAPFPPTY